MNDERQQKHLLEPHTEYGPYSYADYLGWEMEEMVEIIRGRLFRMNPAPKRVHQKISLHIASELYQFLKENPCQVYEAPFDVRLPFQSQNNEEIFTVVQPDICVVQKFVPSRLFTSGDIVKSNCIEGFALDLELLFNEME